MFLNFNWIDWTIIVVLLYYAMTGWRAGFADLGLSFVTFLSSLWLAIKFHSPVGDFFAQKFGVPALWTTVFGYIIVGFLAEAILANIASLLVGRIPKKLLESQYNKILGVCISIFNGIVLISFFLLVLLAFPIRGTIKSDIKGSQLGNFLVSVAQKYGAPIESTIQKAKKTAIEFMTVSPQSQERIALDVAPKEKDLKIDDVLEREMLALVNAEREKVGVKKLTVDVRVIPVARAHSKDMFLRRYFSHINPDGKDAGDRLEAAGIRYSVAGENLAYAPDLQTAHEGLMNSPGHKKNILDPVFGHIGIGIIVTDSYGIMFTQNFTN